MSRFRGPDIEFCSSQNMPSGSISNRLIVPHYFTVRDHEGEAGMVFVRTRKQAETVANQLREEGIKADWYNSARRGELSLILGQFHSNKLQVIVCTVSNWGLTYDEPLKICQSAFSEGIDKPDGNDYAQ
jgi:superfamily II DNA helicase RecQ